MIGIPMGQIKEAVKAAAVEEKKNYPNLSSTSTLQPVGNPDKTLADVSKGQYDRYVRDFQPFELDLIEESQTDTSLIDAVPDDVKQQQSIAANIGKRNRERYGFESSAALKSERSRTEQRGGALGLAGGLNNARVAQDDANKMLMSDLINIGQGVNRSSLSALGTAASNDSARRQQYQADRTSYKNSRTSMLTGLAAVAFMSDINLKENIKFSHKEKGYNLYTWTWNNIAKTLGVDTQPTYGVIAQEILGVKPTAVSKHSSGYLMVNYGVL